MRIVLQRSYLAKSVDFSEYSDTVSYCAYLLIRFALYVCALVVNKHYFDISGILLQKNESQAHNNSIANFCDFIHNKIHVFCGSSTLSFSFFPFSVSKRVYVCVFVCVYVTCSRCAVATLCTAHQASCNAASSTCSSCQPRSTASRSRNFTCCWMRTLINPTVG